MGADTPLPILEVTDVTAGYGGSSILQGLSLQASKDRITGIIGPNGCGKSTLLKVIMGFLPLTSGSVSFNGRDLGRTRPDGRIRAGIAYVAQSRCSFPSLTIRENLALGGYTLPNRAAVKVQMDKVFEQFPVLGKRHDSRASTLSGGQLRLLEIGRFLMVEPDLVILDEPSAGLAPGLVAEVYEQLAALRAGGMSFLVVEQNVRALLEIAEYVFALETGKVSFQGKPEELRESEVLDRLYLGTPRSNGGDK